MDNVTDETLRALERIASDTGRIERPALTDEQVREVVEPVVAQHTKVVRLWEKHRKESRKLGRMLLLANRQVPPRALYRAMGLQKDTYKTMLRRASDYVLADSGEEAP